MITSHLFSTLLNSSHHITSHLISSQLFSIHHITSQLITSLLISSQLFSSQLNTSHQISPHLITSFLVLPCLAPLFFAQHYTSIEYRWSHHCNVSTCDDDILRQAMGDDNTVSKVEFQVQTE